MSYRMSEWAAEDETNLILNRVVEELMNIAETNRQIAELLQTYKKEKKS